MIEDLVTRTAAARSFLAKLWALARPYWFAPEKSEIRLFGLVLLVPERWIARFLLVAILGMNFFLVWLAKQLNAWNAQFFNALQEKNGPRFWELLFSLASFEAFFFSFTGLVFVFIVVAVYRLWLRQLLTIRWRRWITEIYFGDWLSDRTYYRMELLNHGTDNPEQRIEQDVAQFASQTLMIFFGLVSEIATLVTFTAVLWSLSGSMILPLFGGVEVPGFMVWVALVYAIVGSFLTWFIGRRLVRVNFLLERYNADFRYRMTRVRENAESIALYGGERDERRRLSEAFARIYATWWEYMKLNKRLTWLTVFYNQVANVFPIVVQAPRYFAGEIPLGVLTQPAGAFGQVPGSLSFFVDSFSQLADWKAVVDRLTTFAETMTKMKAMAETERAFAKTATTPALELEEVDVALPDGRLLLERVDLVVRPGEAVVVQGPSGSGKTTLFRVLSGLWPFGRGRIDLPAGARILFLPQKPYLPIGTLAEALAYPETPDRYTDDQYREVLVACRLPHLVDRLAEAANWSLVLSPGEQQRLAFARALLYRPDWLFLDEATSALDEATEAHIYRLVKERLPGTTIVSIAHKPSVLRYHERRLRIDPVERRVISEPVPVPAAE
ncbi:MAG: ABC transporter ATP-binding protein/permease [Geminicoccaceae bacterium]|nr:ABC transporter ATP-binding protein/permease [Geminicoccaceae bacterium]